MNLELLGRFALMGATTLALMGNAGGRAAVSGEGNTGAPGEPAKICASCHNGGPYGPILTLLEVTTLGGQLTARYTPGQTYNVKLTVAANAGNPGGYGFQLTALKAGNVNTGTFQNLGANVKQVNATNPNGRTYLEHKGGKSATGVFTARWVAPPVGTGTVDFYYIAAVVDGNNAKTNDNGGLGSSYTLSEQGPGGLPLPYFDDFEFGGGWMTYSDPAAQSPSSWQLGAPPGPAIVGAWSGASAAVTGVFGNYAPGEISYLESPPMDFTPLASDPIIDFAINYDTEAGADGVWLESSSDGGATWYKVGFSGDGTNWYNGFNPLYGEWWDGGSGGWLGASTTVPGVAGMSDVRFRFAFISDAAIEYEGVAIDALTVYEPMPGPPPPPPDPPGDAGPWDPPPPDAGVEDAWQEYLPPDAWQDPPPDAWQEYLPPDAGPGGPPPQDPVPGSCDALCPP